MIHYHLRCGAAHEFDGWFRDSAAYQEQAEAGLIACPHCGERQVARALMAPALTRRGRGRATLDPAVTETVPTGMQPGVALPGAAPRRAEEADPVPAIPDHIRAVLQRMRGEVERRCEYVGGNFSAEARRIHDGQTPARGIYGEATPEQAEALADDGIEVARIPWLPRADA